MTVQTEPSGSEAPLVTIGLRTSDLTSLFQTRSLGQADASIRPLGTCLRSASGPTPAISPFLAISLVVQSSDAADRDTGRQRAPPRFVRRIRSTASSREFASDRASRRQASRSRSDFPLGPANTSGRSHPEVRSPDCETPSSRARQIAFAAS